MKTCPKCNSEFNEIGKWGIRKFCSRKCSNSRICSDEKKKKLSILALDFSKKYPEKYKKPESYIKKECPICRSQFNVRKCESNRIFCSDKCCRLDIKYEFKNRPNSGGYREGSGRSKSGYYKGIYCGSTYELCWAIWANDNNIKFKRFDGYVTDGKIKYFPDFLIVDTNKIIELKGYENETSVNAKTRIAENLGYTVDILRKKDLKPIFDYVEKKHGTKKFYVLYDGYKPKYTYTCNHCNKNFSSDKKRKTEKVCCSRQCSVRFNRKKFLEKI